MNKQEYKKACVTAFSMLKDMSVTPAETLLGYLKKGEKLLFSTEDGESRGLASHAAPAASTTAMHACIGGLRLSPCTLASWFLRADLDWSVRRCTSPADSAAWLPLWGVHDIRCPQAAGGCDCCRGCREGLS